MLFHNQLTDRQVRQFIRQGQIVFGGHYKLKIYGTLRCGSGRRMKRDNRVFFQSQQQALDAGFRPCGHCMKQAYQQWKASCTR